MSEITDIIAGKVAAEVSVLKLEPGDILAVKVGIMDMGDGLPPWIPGKEELEHVYQEVQAVVAEKDVKVLISHMGVNYEIVRGEEIDIIAVKSIPDDR